MLAWGVTSVRLMAEDVAAAGRLARSLGRSRRHPGGVPGGSDLHGEGRLVGSGPSGRLEPGSLSGDCRGGARVRPRGEGARRRRDQADARRHGLVPRAEASAARRCRPAVAEALIGEARARGLRAIVHAPNLADAKAAIAAGATALAHGVLDPIDDATIAVMKSRPGLLRADDGRLRVPRRHARASSTAWSRIPSPRGACLRRSWRNTGPTPTRRGTASGFRTSRTCGAACPSCARTSGGSTPPACRWRSAPTCGRSPASASRSRWTSS